MIVVYGIRKAQITDWNAIQTIYAGARKFMAHTGNPNQWGKDRPPEKTLEKDISEGNLYVLTRDGIITTLIFPRFSTTTGYFSPYFL